MDRIEKLRKEGAPWKKLVFDYVVITIASFVYAVGVTLFLDPNSLAPGGITGVAIILNRLIGLETGTWMMLINIPILLLGVWKFGLRFILSTLYCTVMMSWFIKPFDPCGRGYHGSFAGKPCRRNPDGSIYGLGL